MNKPYKYIIYFICPLILANNGYSYNHCLSPSSILQPDPLKIVYDGHYLDFLESFNPLVKQFRHKEDIGILKELLKLQVWIEDQVVGLERERNPQWIPQIELYQRCIQRINNLMLSKQGYLKYAVVPAGNENGWDVTVLGFAGKWVVDNISDEEPVDVTLQVQLIESLSMTTPDSLTDKQKPIRVTFEQSLETSGNKTVIKESSSELQICVPQAIIYQSMEDQKQFFIEYFNQYEIQKEKSNLSVKDVSEEEKDFSAVSFPFMKVFRYGHSLIQKSFGEAGINVSINSSSDLDTIDFSDPLLISQIQKAKFVLVTIHGFDSDFNKIQQFLRFTRETNPGAIIVAGGVTVTKAAIQQLCIFPEINVFVRGNAVQSFAKLMRQLGKQDPNQALSPSTLALINREYPSDATILNFGGQLTMLNSDKVLHAELELPDPEFDEEIPFVMSSIGCPKQCTFCHNVFGRKIQYMEAKKLNDWLNKRRAWLIKTRAKRGLNGKPFYELDKYGKMVVKFGDDNIFWKKKFIHHLGQILDPNLFELSFYNVSIDSVLNRTDRTIDKSLLETLKKMGIKKLTFGVDGFSNRALRLFNKGYTLEEAYSVMKTCKEMGFDVSFFIIQSDPYMEEKDSVETLMNMLIFAQEFPSEKIYSTPNIIGQFGTPFMNSYLIRNGKAIFKYHMAFMELSHTETTVGATHYPIGLPRLYAPLKYHKSSAGRLRQTFAFIFPSNHPRYGFNFPVNLYPLNKPLEQIYAPNDVDINKGIAVLNRNHWPYLESSISESDFLVEKKIRLLVYLGRLRFYRTRNADEIVEKYKQAAGKLTQQKHLDQLYLASSLLLIENSQVEAAKEYVDKLSDGHPYKEELIEYIENKEKYRLVIQLNHLTGRIVIGESDRGQAASVSIEHSFSAKNEGIILEGQYEIINERIQRVNVQDPSQIEEAGLRDLLEIITLSKYFAGKKVKAYNGFKEFMFLFDSAIDDELTIPNLDKLLERFTQIGMKIFKANLDHIFRSSSDSTPKSHPKKPRTRDSMSSV